MVFVGIGFIIIGIVLIAKAGNNNKNNWFTWRILTGPLILSQKKQTP